MGVPAYVVQHLGGAFEDYQNGVMSGADDNVEKITGLKIIPSTKTIVIGCLDPRVDPTDILGLKEFSAFSGLTEP
jgi:carbonic anhydrase